VSVSEHGRGLPRAGIPIRPRTPDNKKGGPAGEAGPRGWRVMEDGF
jgi:hypothetical protein